jgi:hypothetical protein
MKIQTAGLVLLLAWAATPSVLGSQPEETMSAPV